MTESPPTQCVPLKRRPAVLLTGMTVACLLVVAIGPLQIEDNPFVVSHWTIGQEHWVQGEIRGIDLARIEAVVTRLRGLSFRRTVSAQRITREETRRQFATYDEENLDAWKRYSLSMSAFGLVPRADYSQVLTSFNSTDVAGFYRDRRKSAFIVTDAGAEYPDAEVREEHELILVHELTHALQHQNLNAVNENRRRNSDGALAFQSLMEGDATWIYNAHELEFDGLHLATYQYVNALTDRWIESDRVPLFYARKQVFPYREGFAFVHTLRRLSNDFRYVNQAYVDRPQSTQQILHPERYLSRRWCPVEISWPLLPEEIRGWKMVDEDTMGELMCYTLLDQRLPRELHNDHVWLASRWRGDRYRVYGCAGSYSLLWCSRWTDCRAAREFASKLRAIFPEHEPGKPQGVDWLGGVFDRRRVTRIKQVGCDVTLLYDAPATDADYLWSRGQQPQHRSDVQIGTNLMSDSELAKLHDDTWGRDPVPALKPGQHYPFHPDGDGTWSSASACIRIVQPAEWKFSNRDLRGCTRLTGWGPHGAWFYLDQYRLGPLQPEVARKLISENLRLSVSFRERESWHPMHTAKSVVWTCDGTGRFRASPKDTKDIHCYLVFHRQRALLFVLFTSYESEHYFVLPRGIKSDADPPSVTDPLDGSPVDDFDQIVESIKCY